MTGGCADNAADAFADLRAFARYAYPPNALGYCGPDDPRALLEEFAAGGGAGLRLAAHRFVGAWPDRPSGCCAAVSSRSHSASSIVAGSGGGESLLCMVTGPLSSHDCCAGPAAGSS